MRKCRMCGGSTGEDRYFNCSRCQPILPQIDNQLIYHTEVEEIDDFTEEMIDGLFEVNAFNDQDIGEDDIGGEEFEDDSSEIDGQEEWDNSH